MSRLSFQAHLNSSRVRYASELWDARSYPPAASLSVSDVTQMWDQLVLRHARGNDHGISDGVVLHRSAELDVHQLDLAIFGTAQHGRELNLGRLFLGLTRDNFCEDSSECQDRVSSGHSVRFLKALRFSELVVGSQCSADLRYHDVRHK